MEIMMFTSQLCTQLTPARFHSISRGRQKGRGTERVEKRKKKCPNQLGGGRRVEGGRARKSDEAGVGRRLVRRENKTRRAGQVGRTAGLPRRVFCTHVNITSRIWSNIWCVPVKAKSDYVVHKD